MANYDYKPVPRLYVGEGTPAEMTRYYTKWKFRYVRGQWEREKNCIVLVATHDIEIIRNVRERYESFHFEEQVSRDSLKFDYILRPGILKKPNGIHILEYIGFPEEITEPALEAVRMMGEKDEKDEK